jgi:excisionase family DNA binding protein
MHIRRPFICDHRVTVADKRATLPHSGNSRTRNNHFSIVGYCEFFRIHKKNYIMHMENDVEIPDMPGYLSVKDTAKMLGISDTRVYLYIEKGRLRAVRAANAFMISLEDIENFKRHNVGRPRKNTPPWRKSSGDNIQFMTLVSVSIKPGKLHTLEQKLEEIRHENKHIFPGTVMRSIMSSQMEQGLIVITLIWRGTVMPDEAEREKALEAFRQELADVLDWNTATYDEGTLIIHT